MTIWKEYRLGELMEIKYGKDHKHLRDGPYPLYGSGGIMRYVEKPLYERESILIPRKGTLNNLFYLNQPFWSVDTMFWSKINKDLTFTKYLYYKLKTLDLASLNVGSAVPSLTTEVLNEVAIKLPDLPTQIAIAEILSSLDDKIELNNQINKNLEALAQALFKQWFVDFEFQNENGQPYKSSGGEMVDIDFKQIPKGWTVGILSDVLEIKYGKDHKHLTVGSIPVYGSGGVMRYANEALYENHSILIPRKGTLGNLFYLSKPFWTVDTMFYSIIKSDSLRKYLFYFIKSLDLASMNVGSAVPSMTTKVLNEIKIVLPSDDILQKFEEVVSSMFTKSESLIQENHQIELLRDSLLPKLISGEIEI